MGSATSLFQEGMKVATEIRLFERFLSLIIFLGCASFVAYRQRLSKLDISQILHPEKLGLFLSARKTCKGHSWKHIGDRGHVRVMLQFGEFVLAQYKPCKMHICIFSVFENL